MPHNRLAVRGLASSFRVRKRIAILRARPSGRGSPAACDQTRQIGLCDRTLSSESTQDVDAVGADPGRPSTRCEHQRQPGHDDRARPRYANAVAELDPRVRPRSGPVTGSELFRTPGLSEPNRGFDPGKVPGRLGPAADQGARPPGSSAALTSAPIISPDSTPTTTASHRFVREPRVVEKSGIDVQIHQRASR